MRVSSAPGRWSYLLSGDVCAVSHLVDRTLDDLAAVIHKGLQFPTNQQVDIRIGKSKLYRRANKSDKQGK